MVLGFASSHVQHNGFLRTGLTQKSDSMGKHSEPFPSSPESHQGAGAAIIPNDFFRSC